MNENPKLRRKIVSGKNYNTRMLAKMYFIFDSPEISCQKKR